MMEFERAALFILYLMDIFCNAFLLFAIWKLKKLNTISFRFVFCLSTSDTLFGIFGVIREAIKAATKTPSTNILFVFSSADLFFLNFSSIMILIIAIDRFIHMKYLNRYPRLMTNYKAISLVFANVVFTTHMLVTVLILPRFQLKFLIRHLHAYRVYRVVLGILYVLLMVLVFVMYFWTYCTLRKQVSNMVTFQVVNDEVGNKKDIRKASNKRMRSHRNPSAEFAKGMMIILLCLFLFSVPNVSLTPCRWLIAIYGDRSLKNIAYPIISKAQYYTYMTSILNSSINAIILIVFSSELKAFTKRFFQCFKKTDASTETGTMDTKGEGSRPFERP